MKKELTKLTTELYFYKDGIKKIVDYKDKSTYPSGLYGDINGLYGDIGGLYGNISGLYGNATNIAGNLDNCDISDKDREKGINIEDLINE